MRKAYILVRVYKDIKVEDNDDYVQNAIAIATDFAGDFDTEILDGRLIEEEEGE